MHSCSKSNLITRICTSKGDRRHKLILGYPTAQIPPSAEILPYKTTTNT